MLNYNSRFYGWFGRVADDFTFEHVYELAQTLANYYKQNSTSGQKLVVGYDSRFMAKEFAEFFSCLMAEKGIKVFFSNKVSPSSVISVSALHKKSMGAVVFTGDSYKASFMGIRAMDNRGFFLNEDKLANYVTGAKKGKQEPSFSINKMITKGLIEPFDPTIPYENFLERTVEFSSFLPNVNRMLFNPLYGSGVPYFETVLRHKKVSGFSICDDILADLGGIEPTPSLHANDLYQDMLPYAIEMGFIVSPDCTDFYFTYGPHHLNSEMVLYLISELFSSKGKNGRIVLSDELDINTSALSRLRMKVDIVPDKELYSTLEKRDYLLALDSLGRFYFDHHGVPDALLVGYYLMEIFNQKELNPALILQKIDFLKEISSL